MVYKKKCDISQLSRFRNLLKPQGLGVTLTLSRSRRRTSRKNFEGSIEPIFQVLRGIMKYLRKI